ncbi:protein ALP1-like [Phragmites australis]|uniref:protein ALP1-like n=1 Tax=Phragmites australis TaxID=29695 RepID=UPI002D76E6EC|nr:protein ALP1-like [Phragmites australis]
MKPAQRDRTRVTVDESGIIAVASRRSPPLQTKSSRLLQDRRLNHRTTTTTMRHALQQHPRLSMTPPPAPLLLLTTHSAAAAALLLFLLDPAAARARKRRRRDADHDADDPVPPAPPPPEQPPPPPPPLPLPPTSPDHFPLAFRVSAPTFHFLAGLLDPLLSHPSLPSPVLLALALARLASGLPYPALAALFRVPPSAPRAASRRLRRVLLANFRFWLAFPSEPSSASSAPLPSCRGALGCARFAGPTGPLAAQLVAGASSRVLSLAAGFRGDRTDLEVLRLSSLYQEVEQGRVLDSAQYLVADGGGYPLLLWLMVPFPGPVVPGSPEAEFNAAHKAMCRPVRRAVRSLMGWGAIARLHEEESPRAAVACIGTCAMLHNVLLTREDYSALAPEEEAESVLGGMQSQGDDTGAGAEGFEVDGRALALRSALAATMRDLQAPD